MRIASAQLLLVALSLACAPPAELERPASYRAEIRRTAYGIPHVRADDWGSLGFGSGYALAEDNVCLLAEIFLTARAERALWLGASPQNVASDLYHRLLIERGPPVGPALAPEMAAYIEGATAGWAQYLRDTGVDALPDPRCRGAAWVRPVDVETWLLLHRRSQFERALSPMMVAARPPGSDADAMATPPVDLALLDALGSNAIGLGSEAVADGRALFLGNPHQPWSDSYRFYMKHLTLPGELDLIGASPVDRPFAGVGHTRWLAWNGTVSRATRHSFYRLRLVPGRPTTYLLDGEPQQMVPREVAIRVPGPDGRPVERRHTFWHSHLGPLVVSEALGMRWDERFAWAMRHVDAGWRSSNEILQLARDARTVRDAKAILDRTQGWPVNFIGADHTGEVLYADPGAAANLTDAQLDACAVDGPPRALAGSRSECAWGSDPAAAMPGIFPPRRLPFLFRRDWVANGNDSYWLTNPAAPLEGYPRSLGEERTPRSLRTRIGIRMLRERLSGSDGRPPGMTLEQLQELAFANRDLGGELLADALVARCRAAGGVELADGRRVDLTHACEALAGWDRRTDLESRGAHLFREFLRQGGARWREPFDAARPVETPRGLADDPQVLRALGRAVLDLRDAGVALDARLGEVQHVTRAGRRIPIHGGPGRLGIFNAIRAPLGPGGYTHVEAGSSFVMAVRFDDAGRPQSRALITYSQSANPASPHHFDQTELFSRKGWVEMRFTPEEILADPALETYTVSGAR